MNRLRLVTTSKKETTASISFSGQAITWIMFFLLAVDNYINGSFPKEWDPYIDPTYSNPYQKDPQHGNVAPA